MGMFVNDQDMRRIAAEIASAFLENHRAISHGPSSAVEFRLQRLEKRMSEIAKRVNEPPRFFAPPMRPEDV
jgi:hypothetical protein